MTTTDEDAEHFLPAVFAAQADTAVDPHHVLAVVRSRTERRGTTKRNYMIAGVVAAVVAVAGISAAVLGSNQSDQLATAAGFGLVVITGPGPAPGLPFDSSADPAIGVLQRLTEAHPDDLGFVWIDRSGGTIVVDTVTDSGETAVDQVIATDPVVHPFAADIRTHRVERSRAILEKLVNDVIDFAAEQGARPTMSSIDMENNRVELTVPELPTMLAEAIVERWGKDAVSVRIYKQPIMDVGPELTSLSRRTTGR